MKSWIIVLAAAVGGAAALWGVQGLLAAKSRRVAPDGGPGASAQGAPEAGVAAVDAAPTPALADRPVFFKGEPRQAETPAASQAAAAPAPLPAPPAARGEEPARTEPAPAESARTVPATALEKERGLARATFDGGDRARGVQLLEASYSATKDRPDVDLTPEVERLLQVEARADKRREYLRYLSRYDRTGRVLDLQLESAARKLATAEDSPEAALAAWDELTLAYELATDAVGRKRVLAHLDPFLKSMVFSTRYSPLLKSHIIQPGESLFEIAAQNKTTVDALRRLNGLKSDVIQPKQRIRILPGQVRLEVDKSDFILSATVDGRLLFEFPVGLGKESGTPVGAFTIRVRQKDPAWWRPGEVSIPPGDPRNILGTRWLGFQDTRDFSGFGIHGTSDPSSVGKESSAGCVRLRNEDIELLFDFVPYGAEVVIRR